MNIRLSSPLQLDSIVDGEGIRMVVWMQGCIHNCPGCHNKSTHSLTGGFEMSIDELKGQIKSANHHDGITLTGGDPLLQVAQSLEIAKFAKEEGLNVWCYTGFTYEQLLMMGKRNPLILELLENIDVLIDGKFVQEEKSSDLMFRGSANQRIINVKDSLKKDKVVLVTKYIKKKVHKKPFIKDKHLFL